MGAVGLTVAKTSEAEVMLGAEPRDLLPPSTRGLDRVEEVSRFRTNQSDSGSTEVGTDGLWAIVIETLTDPYEGDPDAWIQEVFARCCLCACSSV